MKWIICAFILVVLTACGAESTPVQQSPEPEAPVSKQAVVKMPNGDRVAFVCSNGTAIYTGSSGGVSAVANADVCK